MLSCRLHALGQLPCSGQEAVGQRGKVVARVQHVGRASLALLQPHEIRAGRKERPRALAVELQDDAADAEHHPHRDHDVVWEQRRRQRERRHVGWSSILTHDPSDGLTDGLEWYVSEGSTEVVVEEAFEDVEGDVGQAGVDVGADGQNHSIRSNYTTCSDVTLEPKTSEASPLLHFQNKTISSIRSMETCEINTA